MIVQMTTGAGKTLVLAGMIAEFNVKPAIIISPKATLAYQLRNEVQKFLGTEVGIMTGSDNDVRDITVATPQMALKSEVLKEAKILLVDECQFLGSHTLFSVARMAKNAYYRIAVSATPWRDGDDDILVEAAINVRNPKSNINASTLINKGKLTPCEINFVKQNDNCGWMGSYAKTYDAAIVNNKSRNNKILNIVKDCIKNDRGSILILINKIGHGNKILEAIKSEIGVHEEIVVMNGKEYKVNSVEFISGCTDMETRNVILQGAREEKVKILIGSTIADEGLDCPALKVLILAGAGKSSTRAFQRVGRVLRLFNGRTKAYIYDFIDENMTFYKHFMYRKALYSTEPEWKKNMKVVNF
jgi:superfamily II DNA or RNA helicase